MAGLEGTCSMPEMRANAHGEVQQHQTTIEHQSMSALQWSATDRSTAVALSSMLQFSQSMCSSDSDSVSRLRRTRNRVQVSTRQDSSRLDCQESRRSERQVTSD